MLFPEEILPEDLEHGTWTPDVSLEPGLQTAGVQMWFWNNACYCELYSYVHFLLSIKVA